MILTVMHCEDCGTELRDWDFFRKRARLIENQAYCTVCRPTRRTVPRPWNELPNGARSLPTNRHLL